MVNWSNKVKGHKDVRAKDEQKLELDWMSQVQQSNEFA